MLIKIATLLLVLNSALIASTNSLELSRGNEETIGILVKNLPDLTVKNNGDTEQAEFPAAKVFANVIGKATNISGHCTYRGKSLIEDCSVHVESKDEASVVASGHDYALEAGSLAEGKTDEGLQRKCP